MIRRITETGAHSDVINTSEMTWWGLRTRVRCIRLDDRNMEGLTRADLLELNEIVWRFFFFFFMVVFFGQRVRGCQHNSSQPDLRPTYENVKGLLAAFRCSLSWFSNLSTC